MKRLRQGAGGAHCSSPGKKNKIMKSVCALALLLLLLPVRYTKV